MCLYTTVFFNFKRNGRYVCPDSIRTDSTRTDSIRTDSIRTDALESR
jgi:hypothetical protein